MPDVVMIANPQYNELRQRLIHLEEMLEQLLGGTKAPQRDIPSAAPVPSDEKAEEPNLQDPVDTGSPGERLAKMKEALKGKGKVG